MCVFVLSSICWHVSGSVVAMREYIITVARKKINRNTNKHTTKPALVAQFLRAAITARCTVCVLHRLMWADRNRRGPEPTTTFITSE